MKLLVGDTLKSIDTFKWDNPNFITNLIAYLFALITLLKAKKDSITDMNDLEYLLVPNAG